MQLSVVISSLRNYGGLRRVLDGYARQDAPPGSFEVIVVIDRADPDPDAVAEAVGTRPYPLRVLSGRIPGLSANRNAGWRAARAPVVLFTDNDTIPVRRVVSEHLAWHRHNFAEEVAVVGHVRWAPEVKVTPFMRWLEHGIQFDYPNIRGVEAGWGRLYSANASIKRSFIERVGDFDEERLPYLYEDLEWAYRASKLGLRVRYNRRAVVEHLRHDMTLELWKERVRLIAVRERALVDLHPKLDPWFHRIFSNATSRPPARGRGRHLIGFVPKWVPLLGPYAWRSADLYWKQALAPHFLAAWEEAPATGDLPLQPELVELGESLAGSSPSEPR